MDKLTSVQEYYLHQFEATMQLYADVLHMELGIMRDLLCLNKRFNYCLCHLELGILQQLKMLQVLGKVHSVDHR